MIEVLEPAVEQDAVPTSVSDAIVIKGMLKCYGATVAVDGLSMHVPKGSVYGLAGPNASGKTTVIRTLATLVKVDSGVVEIDGVDVTSHPREIRARVGYMPDSFGVYERLTVAEYLDFYGASHRIPSVKRRQLVDELLELVDLTHVSRGQAATLSPGLKQRLGLARCLIHDPTVLLLDDPASGMDPDARAELGDILGELRRLGKTILISSNILPELAESCTHVGIIRAGQVIVEGPVQSVVAQLTGEPRVRLRVLEPSHLPAALAVLEKCRECGPIEQEDECTVVTGFAGSDGELVRLLSQLVEAGVRVTGFGREDDTLEDIFPTVSRPGHGQS